MINIIMMSAVNQVKLFYGGKFYSGLLLLPVFVSLVFSYNYHAIWFAYDVIAVVLLFHYFSIGKIMITNMQFFLLVVTITYFLASALNSMNLFFGILSIWDTFKHLIYILLISTVVKYDFFERNIKLSKLIYKLIVFSFFVQVVVVGIQYKSGTHFDNVAGTFGDGGSHAIGFISLLFIVSTIVFSKNHVSVFLVISASILMNVAAENAGFFVLMPIVAFAFLIKHKVNINVIILMSVFMFFSYFVLSMSFYTETSFGGVIMSRFIDLFIIPNYFDVNESHGRGSFLYLAFSIGSWFGVGPGAYSNIYLMEGFDNANLIDSQINISEASHLIAELGIVGFCLTIIVYVSFIVNLFKKTFMKFSMAIFFVVVLFYTAILMNESHIFLFLLTLYFFRILENNQLNTTRLIY